MILVHYTKQHRKSRKPSGASDLAGDKTNHGTAKETERQQLDLLRAAAAAAS